MKTPAILFLSLLSFVAFPSLAQNVVPVQANTNGNLLSPSAFLRTNITGAGNVSVLRSLTGNGIIISNAVGDVSVTMLITVSNALRSIFSTNTAYTSNYLYSLITGGGGSSNTFPASQFTVVSGQVFFKSASEVTNLNSRGTLSADQILATGDVEFGGLITLSTLPSSLLWADAGGVVSPVSFAPHIRFSGGTLSTTGLQPASLTLTNWSLYGTNVLNGKQQGSLTLSNFIAMGITNIVAGSNTVIVTNAGTLVISAIPGGASHDIADSNGFGTNTTFYGAIRIVPKTDGAVALELDLYDGTKRFQFGTYPPDNSLSALWFSGTALSTNYALMGNSSQTHLNAASQIQIRINDTQFWQFNSSGNFLTMTDDQVSIGSDGALRPKNVFIAKLAKAASLTLTTLANSPAFINSHGDLTNYTGTPNGTKFARDDGVLAVPTVTITPAITYPVFAKDTYYTNGNYWAWVQVNVSLFVNNSADRAAIGLYIDQDANGTWEEISNVAQLEAGPTLSDPDITVRQELRDILAPNARFVFTNLNTTLGGAGPTSNVDSSSGKLWKTGY